MYCTKEFILNNVKTPKKEYSIKEIIELTKGQFENITFEKLLSTEAKQKIGFVNDALNISQSFGHLSLYIGLKHTAEELKLPKANYWIYPNGTNHDVAIDNFLKDYKNEFPVVYISFPGAKNPKFETQYPGRTTIEIITPAKYEWFAEWDNTKWKKRGEAYDTLKEYFAQRCWNTCIYMSRK
jgi:all-trans-retinol 13,14-reductase